MVEPKVKLKEEANGLEDWVGVRKSAFRVDQPGALGVVNGPLNCIPRLGVDVGSNGDSFTPGAVPNMLGVCCKRVNWVRGVDGPG